MLAARMMMGRSKTRHPDSQDQDAESGTTQCCPPSVLPYIAMAVHYLPKALIGLGMILLFIGIILTIVGNVEADSGYSAWKKTGPILLGVGGGCVIGGLVWMYWRYRSGRNFENRQVEIPPQGLHNAHKPRNSSVYYINNGQNNGRSAGGTARSSLTPESNVQVGRQVRSGTVPSPSVKTTNTFVPSSPTPDGKTSDASHGQGFVNPNYHRSPPGRLPPIQRDKDAQHLPETRSNTMGKPDLLPAIIPDTSVKETQQDANQSLNKLSQEGSSSNTFAKKPYHFKMDSTAVDIKQDYRGTTNEAFELSDSDSDAGEPREQSYQNKQNEVKAARLSGSDVTATTTGVPQGFPTNMAGEELFMSRNSGCSMASDDPDGVF